ncbi:PEP-CTERM sorting domain-containing protein [Lyngbya sp. CCY1209]|uniref:PEP-CTERM sorting domain-containing protein n=1 Tax=Lyngbya sp. CCY1209 TaxID=2886103 RepID=UPI002D215A3F|nr:PEP-CTERM sorting domain-containing protein [Lyngbya sp. CCY1209]MEB3884396.1 PEP-CTERM sorting domain-containing protein [Lyngbya sp. CCY1209]
MKFGFSNIVASAVLTAGLVSMSATGALARPGGGGGNVAVCQTNVFGDLFTECRDASGNDNETAVATLFADLNLEVIDGWNLDDYKVDSNSGSNDFFTIEETSEGSGTLSFLDSTLTTSPFAFVLKGGNGYAAYLFDDGISQLENLTWETGRPGLSHATLYVFEGDSSGGGGSQEIPEPTAVLGLIAVGGMLVGKKGLSRNS